MRTTVAKELGEASSMFLVHPTSSEAHMKVDRKDRGADPVCEAVNEAALNESKDTHNGDASWVSRLTAFGGSFVPSWSCCHGIAPNSRNNQFE